MNKFDEQTLIAYVDGRLDDEETRRAVEAAIESDVTLRQTVRQLQRTPGLLRAAFEPALHHPPPAELARRILKYDLSPLREPPSRRLRGVVAGVALTLLIGVALGFTLNAYLPLRGKQADEPWLRAVAEYQVLYGRDTLHQADADRATVQLTEQRLGNQLGLSLQIPDLNSHGVAFKRGQLLQFQGRPLAQMAYLPRQGRPLAYCIMPTGRADMPPASGSYEDLNFYYWHHDGFGYVVIADMEPQTLRKIANTVYGTLLIESS